MLGGSRLVNAGPLLPLGLRLTGRLCVVVGAGEFARRRVVGLVGVGAQVQMISPEATPTLAALAAGGVLRWEPRPHRHREQ